MILKKFAILLKKVYDIDILCVFLFSLNLHRREWKIEDKFMDKIQPQLYIYIYRKKPEFNSVHEEVWPSWNRNALSLVLINHSTVRDEVIYTRNRLRFHIKVKSNYIYGQGWDEIFTVGRRLLRNDISNGSKRKWSISLYTGTGTIYRVKLLKRPRPRRYPQGYRHPLTFEIRGL